jgi:carboxypeptidase C (cathepsin A)
MDAVIPELAKKNLMSNIPESQSEQKMMKNSLTILLIVSALNLRAADTAQTNSPSGVTNTPSSAKATVSIPDATQMPVSTTNSVTIGGQRVKYVAETGMLPLLKADGSSRASVFYVAYTRLGETNGARKPITFCFNGGPGSSSVWLHLGALGPRRVRMNEDGTLPKPPFGLVDNEYSILNISDLVFIDPIATGFSRAVKDEKPETFFGQSADLESIGEFIRLWTTRHERWLSPKYLCGESYGVFRAAGLAEHLRSRYGLYFNGLMLVSGVLDFATLDDSPGNDLPFLLHLPNFTAAAYFHKKLPPDLAADLPKALAEAREFAGTGYANALQQGASLPTEERKKIVAELARLTGLPSQIIEDKNLRIDSGVFRKQLLHAEGLILGAYDARITGRDDNPASPAPDFDPSYAATYGPFSAAINSYVREELKFENDLPYELIAGVQPWNYGARNSYPRVTDQLASVMNQNPYMRVLVLGGLRDLVCPMDTMRYSLDHMQLDPAYRTNITYSEFDAGHMMYVNLPDLKQMQKTLEDFVKP